MQAPSLLFSLLFGALLIGLCMSHPPKVQQQRHQLRQGCSSDEFACNDGSCIPDYWKCDQWDDCSGGEDEAGCPCRSDQFTCNDGSCIPGSWKCDQWLDCSEGEDEDGCAVPPHPGNCPGYQFQCFFSYDCVDYTDLCDGEDDCSAGEDELFCDIFGGWKRATKTGWKKMARRVGHWKKAQRK
ncbi:very low-density lipoprotein receptor-like [Acanthaster planci]|uniref:Very low-density lipoprotein receptor-like n=1 Tax=Acanthaster planci TaxID=133434 RepID=A0A8B8A113_ACAPL|nr:very low-density lipoprotein receptor-like [Acanthaster planci]XP_022111042.1 very low-density lipoprotein receptor-like [Acanthaster planci]